MAITVEDGTGLATADSYISVADADTYDLAHQADATWIAASTANKEKGLRLSTQFLDVKFNARWKGEKKLETQALSWPRRDAVDVDDFFIDSASVPQRVKDACVELAVRQVSGESLLPDITTPGIIKRTRDKVGPLETEIEYQGGAGQLKTFSIVNKLLVDLIIPKTRIMRG